METIPSTGTMSSNNGDPKAVVTMMHDFDVDMAFAELDAASSSSFFDSSGSSRNSFESSEEESSQSSGSGSLELEEMLRPHPDGVPTQLEFSGDDIAGVQHFMKSDQVGTVLEELVDRGATMTSLNWLSAHVPTCVLDHLGDEVRQASDFRKISLGNESVSDHLTGDDDTAISELSYQQYAWNDDGDDSDDVDEDEDYYDGDDDECDSIDVPQMPLHLQEPDINQRHTRSAGLENGGHTEIAAAPVERLLQTGKKSSFLKSMGIQMKDPLACDDAKIDTRLRTLDESMPSENSELNGGGRQSAPNIRRLTMVREKSMRSLNSSQTSSASIEGGSESNNRNTKPQEIGPRLVFNSRQTTIQEDNTMDEKGDPGQELSLEHRLACRAFGIGVSTNGVQGKAKASTTNISTFRDPFPDDSDEDKPTQRKSSQKTQRRSSLKKYDSNRKSVRKIIAKEYLPLPHSSAYQCALLFVDISGFTKLATALEPEHLSKAINSYFQLIINEVTAHGGDVLKFAGDGVFVEWKAALPGSSPSLMESKKLSLIECVCVAATCAAKIVAKCSDFPIFAHHALGSISGGPGSQLAKLNVHCGLGMGQIIGVHVGDYEARREYVILGDPIDQVCQAVDAATLGEVAISPQAMVTLTKSCELHDCVQFASAGKPFIIARKAISHFIPRRELVPEKHKNTSPRALSQIVESWQIDSLKQYQKLMSLYVHPVVVADDSSKQNNPRSMGTVQERHREEAELRSVFVLFITPLISVRVTGNKEMDRHLYKLLNNIMNLVTRELNRFSGHLRQFIIDDKGVVLIATFGLRGSTFPNMVAERALPATITLHNALQNELGVQNQVGATIGNTYCGVVGGIKRHEYAVMGPSVNLAARLMSSPKNPGILVDNAVRMVADKSYAFNALPPVKAKGYAELVPIFEPLSPLERSWGRVQPNFVGRKTEIMSVKATAREMALTQCPSKIVYITGESGMGKSTMVVHSIEHVRKLMGASRRRVIVTKHVSKESDLLVPFGIFRSILINVLSYFKISQDDRSFVSYSSSGLDSIGWESLSGCSFQASEATGLTRSADRLTSICRELNAPAAFEELVGHHLLGVEYKPRDSFSNRVKGSNMKSLVVFMAKAFKRCTQEASLVVVALDDVHNMDEMSWKVVQELFDTTSNILFLCTSRPLSTYRLLVGDEFWHELNGKYKAEDRFQIMTVERLQDSEVKTMIAKTLGLQEREISSTLLNDVLMQSNGMPHFANEILETMKRRKGNDSSRGLDEGEGEIAFSSVGELLLHRIDSFDASVRNVLNLGAVLGSSFEMIELVAVLQQISKEQSDIKTVLKKAKDALDVAVSEGILDVTQEGGDFIEEGNEDGFLGQSMRFQESYHESYHSFGSDSPLATLGESSPHLVYIFCHDIWRTTILNLMLDSRKRDMHKTIAKTLEKQEGQNKGDYLSRMKLFSHWKASGESKKAASLALSIGKSFEELGLQDQSIKVFQDALDMWNVGGDSAGFTSEVLNALSVTDLECVIKVYIALAKCLANIHKASESVAAYQNALRILQGSKASDEMPDRSILFPIFSGLFVALKFGQIDQDEECTYEQSLVARFVYETRVHGDPVHYSRTLAMQGEMYGRLGQYEKALEMHMQLAEVYNAEEHSQAICECYGSDRSAQSFCASALWHVQTGNTAKAIETCWYVINDLFPEVERRNVHNSCIMIYPLLWILKDNGHALEARDHFVSIVVEAFEEYFGDGRSTFCLPVFDPIMMVLDIAGHPEVKGFAEYLDWAMDEDNLRFGTVINCSLGHYGRCADSISAEICLLLAERMKDCTEKRHLVRSGLDLTTEVMSLTETKRMIIAGQECREMHARLLKVAHELKMEK